MSQEEPKFSQTAPLFETTFWLQYSNKKLDIYKLDDRIQYYSASFSCIPRNITLIRFSGDYSFHTPYNTTQTNSHQESTSTNNSLFIENLSLQLGPLDCLVPIYMKNCNTLTEYTNFNINGFVEEEGKKILDDMISGNICNEPNRLLTSLLVSYVNLKTYIHKYYFTNITFEHPDINFFWKNKPKYIKDIFTNVQTQVNLYTA